MGLGGFSNTNGGYAPVIEILDVESNYDPLGHYKTTRDHEINLSKVLPQHLRHSVTGGIKKDNGSFFKTNPQLKQHSQLRNSYDNLRNSENQNLRVSVTESLNKQFKEKQKNQSWLSASWNFKL